MKKLYEKDETLFAVGWILFYCLLIAPIRGNFGDGSIWMLLALLATAAALTVFLRSNHLEGKYGLTSWPANWGAFLYFIPMWVITTGNLWGGFGMAYRGAEQVFAVLSMLLVGYVEEVIFRGLLFRAMLKGNVRTAVIVSAVTFGIGHIINLLTGQASLETFAQVIFAIAWGFVFTIVYYRSGSLLPCILAHGLVDAFANFSRSSVIADWAYIGVTILTAAIYCPWLLKHTPPRDPA